MKNIKHQIINIKFITLAMLVIWTALPGQTRQTDSLALVALYDNTDGTNWTNNTNWKSANSIDAWFGVTLTDGRVTRISLANNNLNGLIPLQIGNFSQLNYLYLALNSISGIIPSEFGNLNKLSMFDISNNSLSGTIPSEIWTLNSLSELSLNYNDLSGNIPPEISNLVNLQVLGLSNNDFSGVFPQEIINSSILHYLFANNNSFNGFPDISTLSQLGELYIGYNQLTFEDIEPNMNKFPLFRYEPQDSVGAERDTTVEDGSNPALFISVGGASNQYQWYRDDNLISGATTNPYTITSIDYGDAGAYACQITNTVATELTLYSRPINVTVVTSIRGVDSLALVALYESTDGANWTNNTNWISAEPFNNWFGVTVTNGRVVEINLVENNLNGSIQAEIGNLTNLSRLNLEKNSLTGSIPPEIGNLTNLENLNLSSNSIAGTMPPEIGDLSNLRIIYLYYNSLTGSIPPEIGNLTNLEILYLYYNNLTGIIPPEIGNLTNLTRLYLHINSLSGTIPSEVGNLSNLTNLSLYSNSLTGAISPEIGNLSNLTQLSLHSNNLTGTIPSEIGNLSNLVYLDLYSNNLTGTIPPGIGNLTNLEALRLYGNSFTGEIPPEIGSLANLSSLTLYNNGFTGTIPPEIGNLTNLVSLFIFDNQLSDFPNITSLENLDQLRIENNLFTFEDIEPNVGVPTVTFTYSPQDSIGVESDTTVEAGSNPTLFISVGGASNQYQWYKDANLVTSATANPYTLTSIDFSDAGVYTCRITNTVATELTLYSRAINIKVVASIRGVDSLALVAIYESTDGANWTNSTNWKSVNPIDTWYGVSIAGNRVTQLDLDDNNLNGTLPAEIGNLTAVTHLYLGGTFLSGEIPVEIGNMSGLIHLKLHSNDLSGTLPLEIGNLVNLEILELDHNNLTGAVPATYGNLDSLKSLQLGFNQLNGSIPDEMGNMISLESLNMEVNLLTGSIPISIGNLVNLNGVNLANNPELSGPIPPEIGTLVNLISLELHQCSLTGNIPEELSNLSKLITLRLDGNQLNGIIPSTFVNLVSLQSLNINENQLSELPDLSGIALNDLQIQNNWFTFEDIEPNIGISGFIYSPQESVGSEKDTTIFEGDSFSYTVTVGGVNNVYQWFKDSNPIIGANTSEINISSASAADNGEYILLITNTVATALTLYSRPLTISIGELPTIILTDTYDIRVTTAGLLAEVNPNDLETLVYFEYGLTASYGSDTSIEPDTLFGNTIQEVSKNIYLLQENSTYHYRTVAVNGAGSQYGPNMTFGTNVYNSTETIVASIDYLPQKSTKESYVSTDYRLFGMPGSSIIPMADIIPGTVDDEWIAYYDDGTTSGYKIKYDGSSTFNFSLGKAFWVICQQDININETVSFPDMSVEDLINIPLRSGWNLITNPFTGPVEWEEIKSWNGDISYQLWEWTGGWNNPLNMEPYKGYMIYNANNLTSLGIPFPVSNSKRKTDSSQFDWAIHIHMSSEYLSESALHFGISPLAKFGKDAMDYHKPRMFSDVPGALFSREEWDEEQSAFATDFRPEIDGIQVWSMNVVMPVGKLVEFHFEGVESVPEEYNIILIDRQQRSSVDLRMDPTYTLTSPMKKRQFDIVVGYPEEMDDLLAELVVTDYILAPNFPNPFNPTTVIPIEVPEMTWVELTVYDILGQRVKTLHKGELNSGRHLLSWDGTNGSGIKVASGVYLYRLKTGNGFDAVRKMILLK